MAGRCKSSYSMLFLSFFKWGLDESLCIHHVFGCAFVHSSVTLNSADTTEGRLCRMFSATLVCI